MSTEDGEQEERARLLTMFSSHSVPSGHSALSNKNIKPKGVEPGVLPDTDTHELERGEFENGFQYLMSCIGLAVGLGNIWKFPFLAYNCGGGAFLVPYIIMAIIFGLPALYIEMAIGQFTQSGPSIAFRHYAPILQGLGWAMSVIAFIGSLYYNVIVAWSLIYLFYSITGQNLDWQTCGNKWNSPYCDMTDICEDEDKGYFRSYCISLEDRNLILNDSIAPSNITSANISSVRGVFDADVLVTSVSSMVSSTEEFFTQQILRGHTDFEFKNFNVETAVALFFAWAFVCACLIQGVNYLGKVAVVTSIAPYMLIFILLVNALNLDGSDKGVQYYITKPDWSKLKEYDTWVAALNQVVFSLSTGLGGMLAMSSYNTRKHKLYRDSIMIVVADSFMSILGGVAVFATLGYMAEKRGVGVSEVISGHESEGLAFIAYPEAIASMTHPRLWLCLFFIMIFMLGASTMFGFIESFVTCLADYFAICRRHHSIVVLLTCVVGYGLGCFFFCSQNGYHFFKIFSVAVSNISLSLLIIAEVLIMMFGYGPQKFFRDIKAMMPMPRNWFERVFGCQGYFIKILCIFTAPICALVFGCLMISDLRKFADHSSDVHGDLPWLALVFGFVLFFFPLTMIPYMAFNNYKHFRKRMSLRDTLREMFTMQPDHPVRKYQLPEQESFWGLWKFSPPSSESAVRTTTDSNKDGSESNKDSGPELDGELGVGGAATGESN